MEGPGRRAPPSRHLRPPSSLACRTPASFLLAVRSASTCPLHGPIAPGARGRRGERGGRERLRQGGPGLRRRLAVLASSLFRGRRIGAGSCAGAVLTLQVGRGPARAPRTCHSPGHGRPARRLLRAGAPAAPGLSTCLLCLLGVQKLLLQPSSPRGSGRRPHPRTAEFARGRGESGVLPRSLPRLWSLIFPFGFQEALHVCTSLSQMHVILISSALRPRAFVHWVLRPETQHPSSAPPHPPPRLGLGCSAEGTQVVGQGVPNPCSLRPVVSSSDDFGNR